MAVSSYNTVTAFFDESGKFKDHEVIAFGGVADYNENFGAFANEWNRLLFRNGLQSLSVKTAFNARRPLSRKNNRTGIKERIEDLAPFIACIRNHLQVIVGVTIDVPTFKKMPSHFFQSYGSDPVFVAFTRSLLEVMGFTPDGDKVSFVCDDDEQMAWHMFRLYRRVKNVFPGAKSKMSAITFADDRSLFALQAADLVSGLMRLEADRKWRRIQYDYLPLFKAIRKLPEKGEKLWNVLIAFGDKPALIDVSQSLEAERKRMQANAKTQ